MVLIWGPYGAWLNWVNWYCNDWGWLMIIRGKFFWRPMTAATYQALLPTIRRAGVGERKAEWLMWQIDALFTFFILGLGPTFLLSVAFSFFFSFSSVHQSYFVSSSLFLPKSGSRRGLQSFNPVRYHCQKKLTDFTSRWWWLRLWLRLINLWNILKNYTIC